MRAGMHQLAAQHGDIETVSTCGQHQALVDDFADNDLASVHLHNAAQGIGPPEIHRQACKEPSVASYMGDMNTRRCLMCPLRIQQASCFRRHTHTISRMHMFDPHQGNIQL